MKQLKGELNWPPDFQKAIFLRRPNRFIAYCQIASGEEVLCHVPNPGRLWELLVPGAEVLLADHRDSERKTKWSLIGILREEAAIMVDTGHTNRVAEHLLLEKKIPSLRDWTPIRREVKKDKNRFDFLLENGKGDTLLLEVKSCTLFGGKGAMFPDAPSERGRRHLLHLQEESKCGQQVAVLLLVQWLSAEWFMPDFHTDPDFAKAMVDVREDVLVIVAGIGWNHSLQLTEGVKEIPIIWEMAESENHDSGCYLILLELAEEKKIEIGSLGERKFPRGWYVYCGSAKKNLLSRVNRHLRIRKGMHWHLDYLRKEAKSATGIPFRTQDAIEHPLAKSLAKIADWQVDGFGCSDCQCESHLFGFFEDPRKQNSFVEYLLYWRIGRYDKKVDMKKKKK